MPNNYFSKSDDHKNITVLRKGLFQITVRLVATIGSQQTASTSLLIDGIAISSAYNSITYNYNPHENSHTYQAPIQIVEILELDEGSKISVRAGALGCLGSQQCGAGSTCLTILLLEELE